jgi:hypothetical protein
MHQLSSIELQAVSGGAAAAPRAIIIGREDFGRRGRRFEREDNVALPNVALPRRRTPAAA